jgi:hypothetical protein
MRTYRVSFFKNLVNDNGKPFKICQRAIEIRLAHSRERAIKAAQLRSARVEGIPDWTFHADLLEVEPCAAKREVLATRS